MIDLPACDAAAAAFSVCVCVGNDDDMYTKGASLSLIRKTLLALAYFHEVVVYISRKRRI